MTTSQNKQQMLVHCVYVLFSEVITDTLKHFFVTRMNTIDTNVYYTFTENTLQQFKKGTSLAELKPAYVGKT